MYNPMSKSSRSDLNQFLRQYISRDSNRITHTCIGNIEMGIFPGKYNIPDTEMESFYNIYYKHVFTNKNEEYLTECQVQNGPMLIDLDFRHNKECTTRQYTSEHIYDIIEIYVQNIQRVCKLKSNDEINIYVFEKDSVNITKDVTKDGIHIIIGICMNHIVQEIVRSNVLKEINCVFDSIPLENSYDNVIDDGIPKGHTNWQLYGSRKPKHDAYKLTKHVKYTLTDNQFDIDDIDIVHSPELLKQISARNTSHPSYEYYDDVQDIIKNKTQDKEKKQQKQYNIKHTTDEDMLSITNQEELVQKFNLWFDALEHHDYTIKETHQYVMILPESYYNDFTKWIRVGWALHNCSKSMFLSWMLFSSQSDKFNFNDIAGYYEKWVGFKSHQSSNKSMLTERSIMYWARQENCEKYDAIRNENIDYMIEQTITCCTEWDIANILYQYYKDLFRCGSIKKKTWYYFKRHRWVENDSGNKLRYNISNTLSRLYTDKSNHYGNQSTNPNLTAEQSDILKTKSGTLASIAMNLKQTQYKQNVMREVIEIFYEKDSNFLEKLDQNPYLICFTNGVYDFNEDEFRPGRPDDYISLSTNIKYTPLLTSRSKTQSTIRTEIDTFMTQLFPDITLREYMWEHLASVLIGDNKPQTFNIYNGGGSNGKSKLIELMSRCVGEYMGVVPTSLVTEKRGGVGSLTPEIAELKGKRYAVMQEPSKGDTLNDGVMKMLTGQDPIQANPKYRDPITFIPQFKLVVCTNNLFDIKSNDDGTWRRIRLCEFKSKFVVNPNKKNEYPINFDIEKKFDEWKEIFMSLLVEKARKTNGNVTDTEIVLSASNAYRSEQDYLMQFIQEKIRKREITDSDKLLSIKYIWDHFTEWYKENHGKTIPIKRSELKNFVQRICGDNWSKEFIVVQNNDDEYEASSSV